MVLILLITVDIKLLLSVSHILPHVDSTWLLSLMLILFRTFDSALVLTMVLNEPVMSFSCLTLIISTVFFYLFYNRGYLKTSCFLQNSIFGGLGYSANSLCD